MIEIELVEEVGELNVGVLGSSFTVRKTIPAWHGSLLTTFCAPHSVLDSLHLGYPKSCFSVVALPARHCSMRDL